MTPRDHQDYPSWEIATGTQFHEWRDQQTIPVHLSTDGEASWYLLPSSVTCTLWLHGTKDLFQHLQHNGYKSRLFASTTSTHLPKSVCTL